MDVEGTGCRRSLYQAQARSAKRSLENSVEAGLTVCVRNIGPIANQAADFGIFTP